MKIKPGSLLIMIFMLGCYQGNTQIIRGEINTDKGWEKKVYLIEINNYAFGFSGSENAVADSFLINGADYFKSDKLKKNQLYRLNVVLENSPRGAIIQDGRHDNYVFFATDSSESEIIFTGDIANLFTTYQCISSNSSLNNIQRDISVLKQIKMPVYHLMYDLSLQMDSLAQADSNTLNNFRVKAISDIQKENELSNALLLQSMDSMENPNVIALGLIFDGIGFQDVQKDVLRYKDKLAAYKDLSLIESILNSIISDVDLSFLSAKYKLMDGRHLIMDSLQAKYILLDFWASWCLPCRHSINTTLRDIGTKYKSTLTIIGINTDEKREAALKAIQADKNSNMQIGGATTTEFTAKFKVDKLPTYILINQENKEWHIVDNAESVAQYLEE